MSDVNVELFEQEQPGRDIILTGSIRLTHALIEAGLVDEYRLVESKSFVSGIVLLRYAYAERPAEDLVGQTSGQRGDPHGVRMPS